MTKELELLVKKWRADGIRLNGGADKPYSDDENSVRAFVLEHCAEELGATLAKTQEGGKEFRACVCHTDSDKRLCLHKNDCCVVEAQSTLIAQQKSTGGEDGFYPALGEPPSWFDEWFIAKLDNGERVVLRRLPEEYSYDYTTADGTYFKAFRLKQWMQFPDSKFKQLGNPDSAAPGGGDEAAAFDAWFQSQQGSYYDGMWQFAKAAWMARAALSAPKQVGVIGSEELIAGLADTFNGDDLQLLASARALLDLDKSGSLVPHGIGGHARGIIETFIVRMAYAPQAAPVPVEGDDEEYPDVRQQFTEWLAREMPPGTIIGDPRWWAPKIIRAFHDYRTIAREKSQNQPPEQPAVELEAVGYAVPSQEGYSNDGGDTWYECPDDSAFVDGLAVGDTYDLEVCHLSVTRTYRVTKAPDDESDDYAVEPVALLDGAKAGKGEGHG